MELIKWNKAKQAIIEAKTIDEVKEIRNKVLAINTTQMGESFEVRNGIAEIEIRADRRIGQIFKANKIIARQFNAKKIIENSPFCAICHYSIKSILLVHHIIPVSRGGTADNENLIVLCPNCHMIVHKMISLQKIEDTGFLGRFLMEFEIEDGLNTLLKIKELGLC